jgi:hypothetical protein
MSVQVSGADGSMAMMVEESSKNLVIYSIVNKDVSQRKCYLVMQNQAADAFILITYILLFPYKNVLVFRIMDHVRYSSSLWQCHAQACLAQRKPLLTPKFVN